jgi:hypothetical protein
MYVPIQWTGFVRILLLSFYQVIWQYSTSAACAHLYGHQRSLINSVIKLALFRLRALLHLQCNMLLQQT